MQETNTAKPPQQPNLKRKERKRR